MNLFPSRKSRNLIFLISQGLWYAKIRAQSQSHYHFHISFALSPSFVSILEEGLPEVVFPCREVSCLKYILIQSFIVFLYISGFKTKLDSSTKVIYIPRNNFINHRPNFIPSVIQLKSRYLSKVYNPIVIGHIHTLQTPKFWGLSFNQALCTDLIFFQNMFKLPIVQVVNSSGPSGHNVEYVLKLAEWLHKTLPDVR